MPGSVPPGNFLPRDRALTQASGGNDPSGRFCNIEPCIPARLLDSFQICPVKNQAITITLVLLLFSLFGPFPGSIRALILLGLAVGWVWIGSRWLIRRYGRRAVAGLAGSGAGLCLILGIAYWLDLPNRRLVNQIEQIPGCICYNYPGLLVGQVEEVQITSEATDPDVQKFIELEGLEHLRYLFLNGPRISDQTAKKFSKLPSVKTLYFYQTGVSERTLNELQRLLPECTISNK